LGGRRGRQAPTAAHPFGFGRERYFWAFLVAVVLFTLGSLFALFEGYEKLRHPHVIESPAWAFGALLVAIVLELVAADRHPRGRQGAGRAVVAGVHPPVTEPPAPGCPARGCGGVARAGLRAGGVSLAAVTGSPASMRSECRDRAAARRH